ncbi:MAG: spore coat protein [Ruminococcus sp.]|nr:spore coat protein [Ruminococcus sp.]
MNENNDKSLMMDLLNLEKGVCDLYLHGAVESATGSVHNTFSSALNESLGMQDRIYSEMSAKGWYQNDCAEQEKINSVKQKFSSQSC